FEDPNLLVLSNAIDVLSYLDSDSEQESILLGSGDLSEMISDPASHVRPDDGGAPTASCSERFGPQLPLLLATTEDNFYMVDPATEDPCVLRRSDVIMAHSMISQTGRLNMREVGSSVTIWGSSGS